MWLGALESSMKVDFSLFRRGFDIIQIEKPMPFQEIYTLRPIKITVNYYLSNKFDF